MAPSPLSPSTMRLCLWTICSVGVILNVLVFRKYRSSRCRQSRSVRSSLQLLCVMAAADTISLLALMLALGSHHLGTRHSNKLMVAAVCKLDLFLIHASSAFSIWCWLILSGLRYMAIHHPYKHLRLHREPFFLLVCVAVGCCLLEGWILIDVTYLEDARTCGETLPEGIGKMLQMAEIMWTYFLPLSLIIILDLRVLCCHFGFPKEESNEAAPGRILMHSNTVDSGMETSSGIVGMPPPPRSPPPISYENQPISTGDTATQRSHSPLVSPRMASSDQKSSSRSSAKVKQRRAQQLRILKRCLCISVIDLGMNLPNYLVRLYLILASEETLELAANNGTSLWLQDISQLLYFAQFAMNALYLVAINNYVLPARQHEAAAKTSANLVLAISAHPNSYAITPRKYNR